MNRRMILLTLAMAIPVITTVATTVAQTPAPAHNTLTAAEQTEGWKLLFDGKVIDKWRGFKMPAMPEHWTAVDGTLNLTTPRRAVDIISTEQFGDFDFKFDWKLGEIPAGSNSGVMFYVTEEGEATYHTGPEYQILDNARHPDGKNPLTTAGACYALYAPTRDVTRPIGEWNESRIMIVKGKAQHWLNGEKVVEYDMNSEDWKAKVLGSKFKEWTGFGVARKGHLALQQHGGPIAYRNLKIRTIQ
jgi:hypothetical protein